jgi:hypothetical protein
MKKNSGVYLPLPGCLEAFDKLADRLTSAASPGDKGKGSILQNSISAKNFSDKFSPSNVRKNSTQKRHWI